MKNLNKKIGAIALSGMLVLGGFLASCASVYADSYQDAKINLMYLERQDRSNKKFKVLHSRILRDGVYLRGIQILNSELKKAGKDESYDLYPMEFKDVFDLVDLLNSPRRRYYDGIEVGKEYSGNIGDLIFKFKVLE